MQYFFCWKFNTLKKLYCYYLEKFNTSNKLYRHYLEKFNSLNKLYCYHLDKIRFMKKLKLEKVCNKMVKQLVINIFGYFYQSQNDTLIWVGSAMPMWWWFELVVLSGHERCMWSTASIRELVCTNHLPRTILSYLVWHQHNKVTLNINNYSKQKLCYELRVIPSSL